MVDAGRGEVLWQPAADALAATATGRFLTAAAGRSGRRLDGYGDLWRWSVEDLDGFWSLLWDHFGVEAATPAERTRGQADGSGRGMPGTVWFPGATLNYAARALRPPGVAAGDVAVVARSQTTHDRELTWAQLRDAVGRARAGLRHLGVVRGDRVAAYLPNGVEALVGFLATASLGAVWSSCPPEFGPRSVTDRFRQIGPTVLLAVDGYRYGAKRIDRRAALEQIRAGLPTVRTVVHVPSDRDPAAGPGDLTWADLTGRDPEDGPAEPVAFDHPLYVLYSSGTTGVPKAIVHGHGGILLEHLKSLGLHGDLGPGSRFFWFSTTGWMMWNYLVSGLLVGATVVLFDGDPAYPGLDALWDMAAATRTTYFGVSAPFLLACAKAGVEPARDHDLASVRTVGSTGAPLPADGFRWAHDHVGSHIPVASISGGTDVCTAFLGHDRLLPVRAGELAGPALGVRVAALDAGGSEVIGQQGELVVTEPMPSMPVGLWGDADGSRLHASYFATYPGTWHHGDWITIHSDGSAVITGRSDATLNRAGVRLGTSDFYAVVDAMPEVADSLVVHLDDADGGPGRLVLFVAPAPGTTLDEGLRARLAAELRTQLSPRHVPDEVHAVPAVPRTLSGKRLEVPVKRILQGVEPGRAASRESLADPAALDWFSAFAAGRPPTISGRGS